MVMTATEPAPDSRLIHAARLDPFFFIDRFVWLEPAAGGPPERFRVWHFQRDVLHDIEEHSNLVVLKARQLGLSWLALAYGLWLTTQREGMTMLILNRNLGSAIDLLERIRFMHKHLPRELQQRIIQDTNDQKMPQLVFGNGSKVVSLPSGEDTGSGLTAQYILADEVAKWKWAEETFTAILPIVSGAGTTLVAISTMKGLQTYFARLWKESLPGAADPNGYWPIFIPSSAHPDRDDAWLAAEAKKYPDLRRFKREHPETWQDAFQLTDEATFSEFDRSEHHAEWVREPQWPVWRGVDFGYHFSPAYWIEIQADRVAHVFGELDVRESTTEQLAQAIVARDQEYDLEPGSVPAGVDPAGKARTSQSGTETDHVTLIRAGVGNLRMIDKSVPSDRVDLIKMLLRDGRLLIDCARCPRLAEALESAQWERKRGPDGQMIRGESYAKDGLHEHYLDALGYALVNIWPPSGPLSVTAGGTPAPYRTRRYSTSEFG